MRWRVAATGSAQTLTSDDREKDKIGADDIEKIRKKNIFLYLSKNINICFRVGNHKSLKMTSIEMVVVNRSCLEVITRSICWRRG